jgi:hypothetical protein
MMTSDPDEFVRARAVRAWAHYFFRKKNVEVLRRLFDTYRDETEVLDVREAAFGSFLSVANFPYRERQALTLNTEFSVSPSSPQWQAMNRILSELQGQRPTES